jgi:hypothetical protein
MDIATLSVATDRVPGIQSKPLDNPRRPKPASAADLELARDLDELLRQLPPLSQAASRSEEFPLLGSLFRNDARHNTNLARRLVFIAAANHRTADERRTAEYLLRHHDEYLDGRREPLKLLMAARCAAEMDVRRVRRREIPTEAPLVPEAPTASRAADQSVGEFVIEYLRGATGRGPATAASRSRLLDAIAVAIDLAERHARNGGTKPSVLAMRSDARKAARLVNRLLKEFEDQYTAHSLARLLVGADCTPIETSLLWWAARPDSPPTTVPPSIRERWTRDLAVADERVIGERPRGSGVGLLTDNGRHVLEAGACAGSGPWCLA